MLTRHGLAATCGFFLVGLTLALPGRAEAGTVTVKGSDTMVVLGQRWAEEFMRKHPETSIQVTGGGSGTGISALINGTTDVCEASRVMKDAEKKQLAEKAGAAPVEIPVAKDGLSVYALRERLDDLHILVTRLLKDLGRDDIIVPEATIAALRGHSWPGNIRELKNVLACALAFVESGAPEPRHLRFVTPPSPETALDRLPLGGYSLATLERAAIRQTLVTAGGNKVHAAKALGIAPSTLYEKLKKYGL
jgi:hypothetical protein